MASRERLLGSSQYAFSATTNSLNHISNVLSSISTISNEVLVIINADGLSFIAENSHICRVECTFEKKLFTTFDFNLAFDCDEDDDDNNNNNNYNKFIINIKPIVESLSLALKNVSSTECTLFYKGHGSPFMLIFEDNKMIERCEFQPIINLELEETNSGFEINQNNLLIEGTIKSKVFYNSIKDLKDINTEEIFICGLNSKLSIISKSDMGLSKIFLPNEKSILDNLIINNNNNIDISCYKFSIFELCLKSMKLSTKCKFKRDENLLSLHLLNLFGNDLPRNYSGTIVEFKFLQLVDKELEMKSILKNLDEINDLNDNAINNDAVNGHITSNFNDNDNDTHGNNYNSDQESDYPGIEVPIFL